MSEPSDLTKLTVNLVPDAVSALEQIAALEGNNLTDTVNRALQAYAFMIIQQKAGKKFLLYDEVLDASTAVEFR